MASKLELLVSPPGTGKTTYCIDLFREEISKSLGGLDSRCYFVLPSREHAERIQNLVLRKGAPGLFNAHIISMNDLAPRLLRSASASHPTDGIRRAIIRKILSGEINTGAAFGYFEAVKNFHGFHELLADAVKEFNSNLLEPAEFERISQPLLKNPVFRSKFRDFSIVLKNYEIELKRLGLEESEEDIRRILSGQEVAESPDVVIFDGFYHFTGAQRSLIEIVSRHARRVVVTLTLPRKHALDEILFEYPERTRRFLRKAGFRENGGFSQKSLRVQDEALLHLEKNIFLSEAKVFGGQAVSITKIEAPGMKLEIELIAREIRRLYRETSCHFSDICLIFRSVSPYEMIIRAVFAELQIPVHIHERYQLVQNGFVLTLYRFLKLIRDGWKRDDLFYVMKSSFFSSLISLEDAIIFETATFRENVTSGREAWAKLAETPAIPVSVRRFMMFLGLWECHFLDAKNVRQFGAHADRFFEKLECREYPDADAKRQDIEALSAVRAIFQAAQRYYESSEIRQFNPDAFIDEFLDSIDRGLFSVKPEGKNRVQVYDAVMALPKEFKIVFIGGLLEKSFPQVVSEDPLFKDYERKIMNRSQTLFEERLWRIAGERYFFYMAVTRAKEKLYLTYPAYNAQARRTLPSFFISEVERCFKPGSIGLIRKTLDDFLPSPAEWETGADVERALAETLFSSAKLSASSRNAALSFYNLGKERHRFASLIAYGLRPGGAVITDPLALREFSRLKNVFSSTRLETYAICAFRYFSSKILFLNEPLAGRETTEMGRMLHGALDDYYKNLTREQKNGGAYLRDPQKMRADLWSYLDKQMEAGPFQSEPLYRRAMYLDSMRGALDKFVDHERELGASRNLLPKHFEIGFGKEVNGELDYLKIENGKDTIFIDGKIDRIDVTEDGKNALVIDYKRSSRSLGKKIEKGMELQLPVYMLAARRLLGLHVMGAEHRILTEPKKEGVYLDEFSALLEAGKKQIRTEAEMEDFLSGAEDKIRRISGRIHSADISVKSKSCDYCEFDPVCRFEKWKLVYEKN